MRGKPFTKGYDCRRFDVRLNQTSPRAIARWARRIMDQMGLEFMPLPPCMLEGSFAEDVVTGHSIQDAGDACPGGLEVDPERVGTV